MFFLILTLSTLNLITTVFQIIICSDEVRTLILFLAMLCVACASDSNVTTINGTVWTVPSENLACVAYS